MTSIVDVEPLTAGWTESCDKATQRMGRGLCAALEGQVLDPVADGVIAGDKLTGAQVYDVRRGLTRYPDHQPVATAFARGALDLDLLDVEKSFDLEPAAALRLLQFSH